MTVKLNGIEYTVTPIAGERMCYLVSSSKKDRQPYRVDCLANKGLGHCSCTNWGVERWKNVKQGIYDPCKHQQAIALSEWPQVCKNISKEYQ